MSKIVFKCPACAARFRLEESYAGRRAKCPAKECSETIVLTPEGHNADPRAEKRRQTTAEPRRSAAAKATSGIDSTRSSSSTSRSRRVERLAKQKQRGQKARPQRASAASRSSSRSTLPVAVVSGIAFAALICVGAWFGFTHFLSDTASAESGVVARQPQKSPALVDDAPFAQTARASTMVVKTKAMSSGPSPAQQAQKQREEDRARRTTAMKEQLIPFLTKYCADCHSGAEAEAGIPVDELSSIDQFLTERKSWEKVYRMINSGIMPPADYDPLPTEDESKPVTDLLHEELYSFDCDLVYNPGRPTVQRLNRTEYNNTVQDIFGIDLTPADKFPADDVGEGFDNIGDVLTLPPLLMEKYLNAAEEISAAVIDTRDPRRSVTLTTHGADMKATAGEGGLSGGMQVLASTGTLEKTIEIPASGEYEITIIAGADQAGDEKAKFALVIQDEVVQEFTVQSHRMPETFQKTIRLNDGKQKFGVRFLNDFYDSKSKSKRRDRNLGVGEVRITGPLNGTGQIARSEIHQRFVKAVPDKSTDVVTAAQKVLKPIMEKAFRRPVGNDELFRYAGLVRSAVQEMDESYEQGLSLALQAILISPQFLFRMEKDPALGESERPLDDFEVATRLSYFLWSTLPDDELFELAQQKKLTDPSVLKQQVRRMLKHEKADALVANFASQWLNLRNLEEVSPNRDVFKSFDEKLKRDMRQETELLFSTIMKEDRSVEDLLTARYTFVNQRLARHYGIEGVKSDDFERVSLDGTNRAGVLTHASILTLTSNPGRTSPVKRGKWIMENIFGEPPPPAPPNVPELEETAAVSPELSLREQLAKHREDPSCAACHKVMDPLGLGLENFNAVGQWREKDEGHPIDASGSLPSGESFQGPLELIEIISNRREQFKRTLAEKMLTYALGRGTEYYDKCTIDNCLLSMKEQGNRFSVLVEGIVLSDPFLKKHAAESSESVTMTVP